MQKINFFLMMDMQSGLWQIEMKPESKEKTAFIAQDGLWQFKDVVWIIQLSGKLSMDD